MHLPMIFSFFKRLLYARSNASKEGWPETLSFIQKVWTEEGPFDGMLGFSQGGHGFHIVELPGSAQAFFGLLNIPYSSSCKDVLLNYDC